MYMLRLRWQHNFACGDKNRDTESIIAAWKNCHARLTNHGHEITHYILDNECSRQFRETLDAAGITYELVPPHQHRRNAAERAIRTFKNHFYLD